MTFARALRCLAACLLVAACTTAPSKQTEVEKKSAVVGMSGGTVELTSGSGVEVPAGALPDNVTVTAEEAPEAPPPEEATVVGTPVVFGPEGQQFAVPVTVTLAFDPSLLPAGTDPSHIVIFTAPVGTTTFTSLGGTLVDATHVQAETTHFSVFVPGVASSTDSCAVCAQGRCASSCPTGTASCDGTCRDTQSDPGNCGSCGHACGQNEGCFQGACVASCSKHPTDGCASSNGTCCSGSVMCAGQCANLQNDDRNCGACGTSCAANQQCVSGACAPICANGGTCVQGLCAPSCPSGATTCDGSCTDLQRDYSNCGSCGHTCGQGEGCFQGACVPSCGARADTGCGLSPLPDGGFECCQGSTQCGQQCANLQSDHQNCGACGNACGEEQVCRNGTCGSLCAGSAICFQGLCVNNCPTGSSLCGDRCVATSDDSQNCGACGTVCANGQACYQGACVDTCGGSTQTDGGQDPNKDGGIGPNADGGHSGGCTSDAECGSGASCVAGNCVPRGEDGGFVSDCHHDGCSSGLSCYPDGVCRPGDADGGPACPPQNQCHGLCVDTLNDRHNCGACDHFCSTSESCDQGQCVGGSVDGGTSSDCHQTGCPNGTMCRADGSCQPNTSMDAGPSMSCVSSADCGSGNVCVAGICKMGEMMCQQTGCPSNMTCGGDGVCHPDTSADAGVGPSCAQDSDCGPNGRCIGGTCRVEPTGCQVTGCPVGMICMGDGSCQPDASFDGGSPMSCTTDADCGGGHCIEGLCQGGATGCQATGCPVGMLCMADGHCQPDGSVDAGPGPSCVTSADCPGGTCIEGTCQFSQPDGGVGGSCTSDSECPPETACIAGVCQPRHGTPCEINTQCASGEICFQGMCQPGEPQGDGGTSCPPNAQLCNEACVDYSSDMNNCGACGIMCPAGNYCGGGMCQTGGATDGGGGPMCVTDTMCPPQFSCVAGFCSPNQPDGGTGGSDGGTAPVTCNDLENLASPVQEIQVAEALPTFTGGILEPGVYVERSVVVYTGPGGATGPTNNMQRTTIRYDGHLGEIVNDPTNDNPTLNFMGETNGNILTVTVLCPAGGRSPPPFQYTATSTSFTLYNGNHVETFERQ